MSQSAIIAVLRRASYTVGQANGEFLADLTRPIPSHVTHRYIVRLAFFPSGA